MCVMSSYMYQVTPHLFRGLARYMQKDITTQALPGNNDLHLSEYFVWIRWSVFASPSVFQHSLSKQEYIETEPAIINKKCGSLGMKYSNPSMPSLIFFVKLTAIRLLSIDNLFREENEKYRCITTLAF